MDLTELARAFNVHGRDFDHHHEVYKRLRAECPVAKSEAIADGYWIFSRYEDIDRAYKTPELYSAEKWQEPDGTWRGGDSIPGWQAPPMQPLEVDPPLWRETRVLLTDALSPTAAKGRTDRIAEVVDALIDRYIETGQMNFAHDLAYAVPAYTVMELIGLPADEWHRFAYAEHELLHSAPGTPEYEHGMSEVLWVAEMLRETIIDRKSNPRDDLASTVANGTIFGEPISVDDATAVLRVFVGGGIDTTGDALLAAFRLIDNDRNIRNQLIADPTLIPSALEEVLRLWPPAPVQARSASRDFEIDGKTIRTREQIALPCISANRDEAIFQDPDQVDITRKPNPHLSFASGTHHCPGKTIARIEMRLVMEKVLSRMPDFEIVPGAEDHARLEMPVKFTPGGRVGAVL
jgi:cytochrome P450